jgi:hypothetical protein
MWSLSLVESSFKLWFSDGMPIDAVRGGKGVSSRLIVDRQGFLDLTEIILATLDANGSILRSKAYTSGDEKALCLRLLLRVGGDGGFVLSLIPIFTDPLNTLSPGMATEELYRPCSDLSESRIFHCNSVRKI